MNEEGTYIYAIIAASAPRADELTEHKAVSNSQSAIRNPQFKIPRQTFTARCE
jgi:hypothetical protein